MPKWNMLFWLSIGSLPFIWLLCVWVFIGIFFILRKRKFFESFLFLVFLVCISFTLYWQIYCIKETLWWFQLERHKDIDAGSEDWKKHASDFFIRTELDLFLDGVLIMRGIYFDKHLNLNNEGKRIVQGCDKLAEKLGIKKIGDGKKVREYLINDPTTSKGFKEILKSDSFNQLDRLNEYQMYWAVMDYVDQISPEARDKVRLASIDIGVRYIFEDYYSLTLKDFSEYRKFILTKNKVLDNISWGTWSLFVIITLFLIFCYRLYFVELDREIEDLKITNIGSNGWSEEWRLRETTKDRQHILANSAKVLRQWLRNQNKVFRLRGFMCIFIGEKNIPKIIEFYRKDNEELYKRLAIVKRWGEDERRQL